LTGRADGGCNADGAEVVVLALGCLEILSLFEGGAGSIGVFLERDVDASFAGPGINATQLAVELNAVRVEVDALTSSDDALGGSGGAVLGREAVDGES